MWTVKPLFKLDEEAEIQTNQLQNRPPSCARSGGAIKNRLAKTPNKLDEEAGTQAKSSQKVPSWLARKYFSRRHPTSKRKSAKKYAGNIKNQPGAMR